MTLETLTPDYLTARIATGPARQAVHTAEVQLGWMVSQNEKHAAEVKEKSRRFSTARVGSEGLSG